VGGGVEEDVAPWLGQREVDLVAGRGVAGRAEELVGHDERRLLLGERADIALALGEGEGALDRDHQVLARRRLGAHRVGGLHACGIEQLHRRRS
jgi:hypothetical protein